MEKILVRFFAGMLVVLLAAPAMAVVWQPTPDTNVTLYGVVPVQFFYTNTKTPATDKSDTDLYMQLEWNARVGLMVSHKDFFGHWEIGLPGDERAGWGNGDYTRLLYGTWSINKDMTLSIGQMYTPSYWWSDSAYFVDNGSLGYGDSYDGRIVQIKYGYKGFYIDAAKPHTRSFGFADEDTDTIIPKIYAGYDYSKDKLNLGGGFVYNTFRSTSDASDFKKTIKSWSAYGHGDVGIVDNFFIRFAGFYANNANELGIQGLDTPPIGGYTSTKGAAVLTADNKVKDTKTVAGYAELRANFGKVTSTAGYGYAVSSNTTFDRKDPHQEYWINAIVPVFNADFASMTVTPEIHVFDDMKDSNGDKEPKHTAIGAKLQLNF